jgi:hypothetical protein
VIASIPAGNSISRLSTEVYTPIGRGAVRGIENRRFFLKIGDDPAANPFVKRAGPALEE